MREVWAVGVLRMVSLCVPCACMLMCCVPYIGSSVPYIVSSVPYIGSSVPM